jgi:hypothetical protein
MWLVRQIEVIVVLSSIPTALVIHREKGKLIMDKTGN